MKTFFRNNYLYIRVKSPSLFTSSHAENSFDRTLDSIINKIYPFFHYGIFTEDIRTTFLRKMAKAAIDRLLVNQKELPSVFDISDTLISSLREIEEENKRCNFKSEICHNVRQSHFDSNFNDLYDQGLLGLIHSCGFSNNTKHIVFLSLGCGRGDKEKSANSFLRNQDFLRDVELQWIGLDSSSFENSFFEEPGNSFQLLNSTIQTKDTHAHIAGIKPKKNTIIICTALLSLHHMLEDVKTVTYRSTGCNALLIWEEPISKHHENDMLHQILRLAYDILANYSFDTEWSREFMKKPKLFRAKYLIKEELEQEFDVTLIRNRSPESFIYTKVLS